MGVGAACPPRPGPGQWRLAVAPPPGDIGATMWNEPYLETCCRSALHRLVLCGALGRPPGLKDGPCLERLRRLGFSEQRGDDRYVITDAGEARHGTEVLKQPA